jgi:hypothetical protein
MSFQLGNGRCKDVDVNGGGKGIVVAELMRVILAIL